MTVKEKLISLRAKCLREDNWSDADDEPTDGDLIDFLEEGSVNYERKVSGSRWWDNIEKVSEVEGTYFRYLSARTTGDMSAWEAGWQFDWSTLEEVEPYTETITVTKYRPK